MVKVKNKNTRFKQLIAAIEKLEEDKEYQLRLKFAEGFISAGNLSLGSFIFSKIFVDAEIKIAPVITGLLIFCFFYSFAVLLILPKDKK